MPLHYIQRKRYLNEDTGKWEFDNKIVSEHFGTFGRSVDYHCEFMGEERGEDTSVGELIKCFVDDLPIKNVIKVSLVENDLLLPQSSCQFGVPTNRKGKVEINYKITDASINTTFTISKNDEKVAGGYATIYGMSSVSDPSKLDFQKSTLNLDNDDLERIEKICNV